MAPPDLTILFNAEASEWDNYLSHYFENPTDLVPTTVEHELIEEVPFPIPLSRTQNFSDARAVLVILSPAFLDFLDSHAEEGYQIGKLLKPSRTVAMLCGVQENDVTSSHKAALASYDDWPHLVALDKDVNMVRNVVDAIRDLLVRSRENERMHKAQFKLVPRKVNEGNGKVFILLHKPQEENQKVKVSLEGCGMKEVPVKRRNSFTFQFMVPDSYMQTVNVVKVHVRCGDNFLGISQIKCESKMGELHNLLSSVNSPYEFLCHTLGIASLHEVDYHLAKVFRQKLPSSGLSIFNLEDKFEKKESKDEFPTLLHFAARYGLCKLTAELLKCPGAEMANNLKNVRGLIPVQLANHAGHNDTAATLEDFQRKNIEPYGKDNLNQSGCSTSVVYEEMEGCNNFTEYYDIPSPNPVPVLHSPISSPESIEADEEKECEYLKMMGLKPSAAENLEPHEKVILGIDGLHGYNDNILLSPTINENLSLHEKISPTEQKKITIFESQTKLIEIMEAYKKGASLTEVVTLHNEWKSKYQVSDAEAKDTLDNLRNLFANNTQKPKPNKKQSLSFSEVRHYFSKLRRKDSIGVKSNPNRKMSKEINSTEKLGVEADGTRPSSTLSIMSNTSSSSGSSFDRLSTVSGGSDSGNHSDFGDEANRNKEVPRFESRYQHNSGVNGYSSLLHLQRNPFYLSSVTSKPPPPPPRPAKPPQVKVSDAKNNDIYYSSPRKLSSPILDIPLKSLDYVLPDSCNCNSENSLTGLILNSSISKSADNILSLSENGSRLQEDAEYHYNTPISPRLSSGQKSNQSNKLLNPNKPVSIAAQKTEGRIFHAISASSHLNICDYQEEYDMVPPPLPLSVPSKCCCHEVEYDIVPPPLPVSLPPRQSCRSPKIDENIRFCDIPDSVPSRCLPKPSVGLSSFDYDCPKSSHTMKKLPLTRQSFSTCMSIPQSKTIVIPHTCCSGSAVYDIPLSPRKASLPTIPSTDMPTEFNLNLLKTAESSKLTENKQSHYCNMHFRKSRESDDSIPDELAPSPPFEEDEEDHYKIVGVPIPVTDENSPNMKCSTESCSLPVYTRHS